jgi:hypothetical protein
MSYSELIKSYSCGSTVEALINILSKRTKHKKQRIKLTDVKSALAGRKMVTITLLPVNNGYYLEDHVLTCLYDPTDSRYHVLDSYIARTAFNIRSMDSDQFDHFMALISLPMTRDHWCEIAGLPFDSVFKYNGPDTKYKISVRSYPFKVSRFHYVQTLVPLSHLT